jgi:hypothetical protein
MRAVVVAIDPLGRIANGRKPGHNAPAELLMGREDACVDDVDVDARAVAHHGGVVIQREGALVDAVDAPGIRATGGGSLRGIELNSCE